MTLLFFLFQTNFVVNGLRVNQARQIVAFQFLIALLYELSDFLFFSEELDRVSVLKQRVRRVLKLIRCGATFHQDSPRRTDLSLWCILLHICYLLFFNFIITYRRRTTVKWWMASLVAFFVPSSETRLILPVFVSLSSKGYSFKKVSWSHRSLVVTHRDILCLDLGSVFRLVVD